MGFISGLVVVAQQGSGNAVQSGGLTGLEIFLLIVVIIELVLLILLFGGYRRLREIHFVVTESALGQVDAFVSAFKDAEQLRDPEKVALVLRELRRFMDSLQDSLRKHYERYSSEMSLLDLLPRKRAAKAPSQEPSVAPPTPTPRIKPQEAAEKDEEAEEQEEVGKKEATKRPKTPIKKPKESAADKPRRQEGPSSEQEPDPAPSSEP